MFLFIDLTAQPKEKAPVLLKSPTDWKFERMDLPFDFAPGINYKGFEEIRFSPGMFDTTSDYYFTYVFAISISNTKQIGANEIKTFLNKYYRGLSMSAGKEKKLLPDTSLIKSNVMFLNKINATCYTYEASVIFFDTFTNGRKVILTMEIEIAQDFNSDGAYMIAIVSADNETEEIWNKLHDIRKAIDLN